MKRKSMFCGLLAIILLLAGLPGFVKANETVAEESLAIKYLEIADEFRNEFKEDEYGGMYLNENGELIINVIGAASTKSITNYLSNTLQVNNKKQNKFSSKEGAIIVKVNNVQNSLSMLNSNIEKILSNANTLGVESVYLDEKENKIIIETKENPDDVKIRVSEIVDISNCKIVKTEVTFTTTADKAVGVGTKASGALGEFSIGFPAKYNGLTGYTVPGHAVNLNETIKYDGKNLGKVRYKKVGGAHDIAFVEKIDIPGIFGIGAITWVDNLETSNGAIESLPANVVTPIQGMKVYFKGMKSNDQNGVIESTNFGTSMEVNGSVVTFSNMVLSTYKAIKGDSGGPVFWVDPSSTYPKNGSYTLGMQSMSSLGPNGEWLAASRSVFCKRSSIESVGITFNKFW